MPKSTSLTYQAYDAVRQMVLSGQIVPGGKIKIDELREQLDIGASPVREALSLLSSEGLIERVEQRGFRAARVSAGDFKELLKTRCWAEERALREAIKYGNSAWQEQIVLTEYRLSNTTREPHSENKGGGWEDVHQDFHKALIAACPSNYLLQFCNQLYDMNVRYRNIASLIAYPSRNVENEHKEIAKQTLDRNADKAVEALIAHYNRTGNYLLNKMSEIEE